MAYSLRVRQHEIIIVQGFENQSLVFDLFTTGMNPCVGLVLWHPEFCALAHIDGPEHISLFAPVLAAFSGYCKDDISTPVKPFASIVMAHGVGGSDGWSSEHMKTDIEKLCNESKVAVGVVRPMRPGESAIVKINVSNGARDYGFDPGQQSFHVETKPESESWFKTPIGSSFRFGFFAGTVETACVTYVKGEDSEAVTDALANPG